MPEGDTIHRTASALRRALEGDTIAQGPARLVGEQVAAVESRGKHLLIWFEPSGLALHSHMRMHGSWHLYRPGERWRRSPGAAKVTLATDDWVAVCFAAPVCELLTGREIARHPSLASLGPDALDPVTDLAEARRRLDAMPDRLIGDALLDQRIMAGVGNVYRCEALFLTRVHPRTAVRDLDAATRDEVLRAAERLLKANVGTVRRRTTTGSPERLHVYGRAGRACLRCGRAIAVARQGVDARVTYWCPTCQRPTAAGEQSVAPGGAARKTGSRRTRADEHPPNGGRPRAGGGASNR